MQKKRLFKSLFLYLSIILVLLPILLIFNNVLTRIIESVRLYTFINKAVVPIQVRTIGLIVKPFVNDFIALDDRLVVNSIELRLTWNCLGWQSLLLFLISFVVAISGNSYTLKTKVEAGLLGLFGIFWMNILRMSFTVLLALYAKPVFRYVYHDYLAAGTTIIFLMFFWWFAYSYILEEKGEKNNYIRHKPV